MNTRRKIVVVDDDEMTLELIKFTLGEQGYDVFTAADSMQAIKKIQEEKPDLVIIDVMLPDLSGIELLNLMRSGEFMEQAPVIVMSRLDHSKIIRTAEKLGAIDYLVKPVEMDQLIEKIARLPGFGVPSV
jgi:two-component system alkaline phosphatase synthesis response regulator PhoP